MICGDWGEARGLGPFDLVFNDGGPKREPGAPRLIAPLLRLGGLMVLDDYTPGRPGPDTSRVMWLDDPNWSATEVMVSPEASVILAVRTA